MQFTGMAAASATVPVNCALRPGLPVADGIEENADRAARVSHGPQRCQSSRAGMDVEADNFVAVLVGDEQNIVRWVEGEETGSSSSRGLPA